METDTASTIPLPPVDAQGDLLRRFDRAVNTTPFCGDEKKRRSEALRQFTAEEAEEIKRLWFDRQAAQQIAISERELEREKQQRESRLHGFLSDVGPRLAGATLDNFVVSTDPAYRKAQQAVVAKMRDYVANLAENIKNGVGLWLRGSVGTGKDHFLTAIAKTAILDYGMGATTTYNPETGKIVIPVVRRGLSVARITGSAIFRGAREAMKDDEEASFMRELTNPNILILSDPVPVQGELTPFQAQVLYEAVDTRNAQQRPTWTTLNVIDNDEADRRLGPAIADRLRHDAIEVECRWPSWRTEREAPA